MRPLLKHSTPEQRRNLETLLGLQPLQPHERICEISFPDFVKQAWPHVEPAVAIQWNWHLDILCERLTRLAHKDARDTVFNVPPGTMKSLMASVFWPTWIWTWWPEWRGVMTSYGQGISTRDSLKRRAIVQSNWYRSEFGVKLGNDQNEKMRFENTVGGWMFATTTGGAMTGEHPDGIVMDDSSKADDVFNEGARQGVLDWYQQTVSTRGVSRNVTRVAIAQRLHKQDLSGYLLESGKWDHICLPMRFEPGRETNHPQDPRTEEGDLLWPELFDEQRTQDLEAALGISQTAGQLQQRPPDQIAGLEWPASYWDGIYCEEHHWPERFEWGVIAVDPSKGKSTKKGDYSAIVFVGLAGGKLWVDADLERRPVEKIVNDGIEMALRYAESLHGFAVETNGFQELLADEFERQTKLRGMMPLPLFTVENRVNKKLRIGRLGPYFSRRAIVVRNNQGGQLFIKQCSQFSQAESAGVHDDGPDCAEVAIRVLLHLQGIDVDAQQTPETGGTMIQN